MKKIATITTVALTLLLLAGLLVLPAAAAPPQPPAKTETGTSERAPGAKTEKQPEAAAPVSKALPTESPNGILANVFGPEDFEGTFPPTGWALYETGDASDPGWVWNTSYAHSPTHSAYHNDDDLATSAIAWLVMPVVTPTVSNALVFWQYQTYASYYEYHGIWASTGSCDPNDGQFAEVVELGVGTGYTWEEKSVDLSAYAGQRVCLAFRYEGDWADEWYIDDVAVVEPAPVYDGSTKTVDPAGTVLPGDTLTYTIVISNSGNLSGTATLTDPIPAGAGYIPGTAAVDPAGYGILDDSAGIQWTGLVTVGESVTVTFQVTVTAGMGELVTNTAVISDPLTSAAVTMDVVNRTPAVGFGGSWKDVDRGEVVMGELLAYTIYITNSGDYTSTAGLMHDQLPAGLLVAGASMAPAGRGALSYSVGGDVVEWTTDAANPLAAGLDVTITIVATATDALVCGAPFVNSADISDSLAPDAVTVESPPVRPVYAAPMLAEGFEGAAFPPAGWASFIGENGLGTGQNWVRSTLAPNTGAAHAYVRYEDVTGGTAEDWLVTPQVRLEAGASLLSFYARDGYSSDYGNIYTVRVSTGSQTTHADFITVATYYETDFIYDVYQNFTVDLSAYIGQDIYVAFVMENDDGDNFYLDDVMLGVPPWYPCPSVSIDPDQSGSVCQGGTIDYPLTVANNNDAADVLDITLAGNAWPTTVNPDQLALDPGASGVVTVTVEVPWLTGGDTDVVTITAAAQGSGLNDLALLDTTSYDLAMGWESITPTLRGTRYHAVAYYDDALYQFGGETGWWTWIDQVNRYDIAADSWTTTTVMLSGTYGMDAVTIGDKIYIPGGNVSTVAPNAPGPRLDLLQIYDPVAETWSLGASLPYSGGLAYASGVAYNGELYVIGGLDANAQFTNTLYIYNPASDTWRVGAPMSQTRGLAAAAAIGDYIYVAGGWTGGQIMRDSLEIYDPATDSWTFGPAMPDPDGGFQGWAPYGDGVKHDRYLLAFNGGDIDTGATWTCSTNAVAFDTLTGQWMTLPSLPRCLYGAQGDGDGNEFWFVSGRTNEGGVWHMALEGERLVQCPACEPPQGALEFDPLTPLVGETVNFTGTLVSGTPAGVTYEWDFGDGSGASGASASHSYAAANTYNIVLTVTNICGYDVVTGTISVVAAPEPPHAAFTSNSPVLVGTPMQFTNQSWGSGVLYYTWDFGDGVGSSHATNPAYTYALGGHYTVTLNVTSTYGADSVEQVVNVTWNPLVAAFTSNSPVYVGDPMQFTDQSTGSGPFEYEWDFGDGVGGSALQNPAYTYAGIGAYTVTLVVTSPYETDSAQHAVMVVVSPTCGFTFAPAQPGENEPVQFTNQSTGSEPISYEWDFGDGAISTATNPIHAYTAANTYTVYLTATNAWGLSVCSDDVVVVGEPPTADFDSSCPDVIGQTSHFTNTSTGARPFTAFLWSFGDGGLAFTENPSHLYVAADTYTVSLQISNKYGTDSIEKTCVIQEAPPPCIAVTGVKYEYTPATIYAGDTVTFTATYTPSNATSPVLTWDVDGTSIGTGTLVSYLFAVTGTFTVTVNADNCIGTGHVGHADYAETLTVIEGVTPPTEYKIYLPVVMKNA